MLADEKKALYLLGVAEVLRAVEATQASFAS